MKKLLPVLVLMILASVLATPVIGMESPPRAFCVMENNLTGSHWTNKGYNCSTPGDQCYYDDNLFACGPCCFLDSIYIYTNWISIGIIILIPIIVFLDIIIARKYPEKSISKKGYIILVVVGIIIIGIIKLLLYINPDLVIEIIGSFLDKLGL